MKRNMTALLFNGAHCTVKHFVCVSVGDWRGSEERNWRCYSVCHHWPRASPGRLVQPHLPQQSANRSTRHPSVVQTEVGQLKLFTSPSTLVLLTFTRTLRTGASNLQPPEHTSFSHYVLTARTKLSTNGSTCYFQIIYSFWLNWPFFKIKTSNHFLAGNMHNCFGNQFDIYPVLFKLLYM